jgi:hypothetical protein
VLGTVEEKYLYCGISTTQKCKKREKKSESARVREEKSWKRKSKAKQQYLERS